MQNRRSQCPINLTLEILGDRWSLLILRDIIFGGRRHFRELLQSEEGIASNMLADRLDRLVRQGLLTRSDDPSHKQKAVYSLTESGIQLLPILAHIGKWGSDWLPVSAELSIRARVLWDGGPKMWAAFMQDLRVEHLGHAAPRKARRPVRELLQAAYEKTRDAAARRRRQSET